MNRATRALARPLAVFLLGLLGTSCTHRQPPESAPGPTANPVAASPAANSNGPPASDKTAEQDVQKITKTDAQWRAEMTPEQYEVMRHEGTERAFTGALWNEHRHGIYRCAACGQVLFRSDEKFESGTGWPSFFAPADPKNIATHTDDSLGMERVEVHCSRCGGHLGHVFDDGPRPTHLRYCINSVSLKFDSAR